MIVESLHINHVRNLKDVSFEPIEGINVFCGDNGAGKTSILEALVILAKGRSFRSSRIATVIGRDTPSLLVVADIRSSQGVRHKIGLERSAGSWQARMDGNDLKSISDTAAHLPIVLMEPNSHLLISGGPDVRRRYLDWGVFHVKHEFLQTWRRYARAIKQRNAALRQRQRAVVQSLQPQLIDLAGEVTALREGISEQLFYSVVNMTRKMSPELGDIELQYSRGWVGESFGEALDRAFERDAERGLTSVGPHRADVLIKVNGVRVKDSLSRGEQKVLAAAMLLSQAELMRQANTTPLLLLDDLVAEFDRDHLTKVLEEGERQEAQVFVTGTDPQPYVTSAGNRASVFHVKHGKIVRQ